MPCSIAHAPIARIVSSLQTAPVGLFGEVTMTAFVRSVRAASRSATFGSKFTSAPANTSTGLPPASLTASG